MSKKCVLSAYTEVVLVDKMRLSSDQILHAVDLCILALMEKR